MAILVLCLLAIIHRYIMLAILISNEYLLNIILLNPLGCAVLLPVTFVRMRAEKFSTLLVVRFQGKLLLPSSKYQQAVHMIALPMGFIHQSECPPERELVSSCPCATDGETEAHQRSSKMLCSLCRTNSARLENYIQCIFQWVIDA